MDIVVHTLLDSRRDIMVLEDKLYWSVHFRDNGYIERANLDGSGKSHLASSTSFPWGLTFDSHER